MMACQTHKTNRKWKLGWIVVVLACGLALAGIDQELRSHSFVTVDQSLCDLTKSRYHMRDAEGFEVLETLDEFEQRNGSRQLFGQVLDLTGKGLSGVSVQIDDGGRPEPRMDDEDLASSLAITDEEGYFLLRPGRRGLFTLVISDGRHCPVWIQNVPTGLKNWQIQLQPSTVLTGQVLIAQRGRSIPVPGIEVRAALDESCGPVPIALASDRITVTDTRGCFVFHGLGVQLRDGRQCAQEPGLSPALAWTVRCGSVGDTVLLLPENRRVHVKLLVSPKVSRDGHTEHQVFSFAETIR